MEANKPSVTALIAAFYRGHHHACDNPRIFADSLAFQLLTPSVRQSLETILIDALSKLDPEAVKSCPDRAAMIGQVMRLGASSAIILARARYTEEKLSEAISRGVRQYVLIGAGIFSTCPAISSFAFNRENDVIG